MQLSKIYEFTELSHISPIHTEDDDDGGGWIWGGGGGVGDGGGGGGNDDDNIIRFSSLWAACSEFGSTDFVDKSCNSQFAVVPCR